MSKVIEGLRYSESHEWVKQDGGLALVGVSDFAQKEMGDITYADLPEIDDEVTAGEEFGALESVKASSELISPLSGTVIEVNAALETAPELINQDAYAHWLIKIRPDDLSELDRLMDAAAYRKMIGE